MLYELPSDAEFGHVIGRIVTQHFSSRRHYYSALPTHSRDCNANGIFLHRSGDNAYMSPVSCQYLSCMWAVHIKGESIVASQGDYSFLPQEQIDQLPAELGTSFLK